MRWTLAAALLLTSGCSRTYRSAALHVRYEPPSGFSLAEEVAQPVPTARFSNGLILAFVPGDVPMLTDPVPGPDVEQALKRAGIGAGGTPRPCRDGTLPAGAVFRCEIAGSGARSLVYLFPRAGHYLVAAFSAPEGRYGTEAARVERSLSTLAVDDSPSQ